MQTDDRHDFLPNGAIPSRYTECFSISVFFLFLMWILTFSVHFQFTEAQPILCRRENKNLDTQYTRVYN